MSIILSSQVNAASSDIVTDFISNMSDSFGLPGFPQPGHTNRILDGFDTGLGKVNDVVNRLMGKSKNINDPNYVDSGKQTIIGGGIQSGKVPPLEEANIRQVYSQAPRASVIIKKRAFSSLRTLYNPAYMDPAEAWLLRATKRLVSRKCDVMADYERLSKIERLLDAGVGAGAIMASLITSANEELDRGINGANAFASSSEFEKILRLRQPPTTSTYFADDPGPNYLVEKFGIGSGVFEITMVSSLSTTLSINGNDSCQFSIEDPYRILFITETDIEMALRDTMLASTVNKLNSSASSALLNAQSSDELLDEQRRKRNVSPITFSVAAGGSDISAVIDAIGMEINPSNLEDIPEPHNLIDGEAEFFITTYNGLKLYSEAMNKTLLGGANLGAATEKKLKDEIDYARKRMRLFYLGKSIIQPMDTVNIFIDGGTRKSGEGEKVNDLTHVEGPLDVLANVINTRGSAVEIDESLLKQEYDRYVASKLGKMTFEDFKRIRTLSYSTESATHVFCGLVESVADKFNSDSGAYVLEISGKSNLEWLKISRYNAQPSLTQMENLVYDPLTPFVFKLDKATGLPTGKPVLNQANKEKLGNKKCRMFFNSGSKTSKEVTSENDFIQDVQRVGGNLIPIYQHAPGLVYRWKENIMTSIYNQYITDPLDNTLTNMGQIKRDIGQHAANTPFDSMDSANIISILVTGKPYNYSTFIQSAVNSTIFNPDISLNSGKDYFHSLIRNLKSEIEVNGNFIPFKSQVIDQQELAKMVVLQQQLSGKSQELEILRNQQATILDQIANLPEGIQDTSISAELNKRNMILQQEIEQVEKKLTLMAKGGEELKTGVINIAGNDITFDISDVNTPEKFKLFGDRLLFATQRRREDVVRNIDKNYFIVSDEYDKDYDIQAFVQKFMEQDYNLWEGSMQSVIEICKNVAEIINFELFCNSQGHIVFRPPQYNRTPASVLNSMLSLAKAGGITLFPEFLTHLFESREKALLREVTIKEWEIRKEAATLGISETKEIEDFIYSDTGSGFLFLIDKGNNILKAASLNETLSDKDRENFLRQLKLSSTQLQLSNSNHNKIVGHFSAIAQRNLQKDLINTSGPSNVVGTLRYTFEEEKGKEAYENACRALADLGVQQYRNYEEFDKVKTGAKRNGKSNTATDVSRIISQIASLVNQRSKYVRSLIRALEQNREVSSLSSDGDLILKQETIFNGNNLPKSLANKLIEDDTKNALGHLSGERFVIKDEHIIDATFSERPPEFTNVTIKGSTPFVGNSGGIAGTKEFTALGVDFDLWRQYGWRLNKPFDKPFFSDAQLQCAPYAVMLLSRQRKNIVTGTLTVMGNEFYQLGDVVYVTHRQLLYYIDSVSHRFDYNGDFKTSLSLKYGHAPGEYIPTPLDIIGKQMINKANSHTGYRLRRALPRQNHVIGTILFENDSTDMFSGEHKERNYQQLLKAATMAKTEIRTDDALNSVRVYCMTFFGDEDLQNERANIVKKWFENPERPRVGNNDIGVGNIVAQPGQINGDIANNKIESRFIEVKRVNQCLPEEETLTQAEHDLLNQGISASQEAIAIDGSLGNVVEIKLVQPPVGGWTKDE